jgi:hypothetical protein
MGIALDYEQYSDPTTYCLKNLNNQWVITKVEFGSDINFGVCP